MLGVYTILQVAEDGWGSAQTLVLGAVSLALLSAVRRPPGADREPADAAAAVPLAQRRRAPTSSRRCSSSGCSGCSSSAPSTSSESSATTRSRSGSPSCRRRSSWGLMSLPVHRPAEPPLRPKATLLPGIVFIGVGMILFSRPRSTATTGADVMPAMILFGFGAGLAFPSLMTLAMSGATPEDSGLASGPRQHERPGRRRDRPRRARDARERAHRQPARRRRVELAALNSGYHLAYLIGACLVGVARWSP